MSVTCNAQIKKNIMKRLNMNVECDDNYISVIKSIIEFENISGIKIIENFIEIKNDNDIKFWLLFFINNKCETYNQICSDLINYLFFCQINIDKINVVVEKIKNAYNVFLDKKNYQRERILSELNRLQEEYLTVEKYSWQWNDINNHINDAKARAKRYNIRVANYNGIWVAKD